MAKANTLIITTVLIIVGFTAAALTYKLLAPPNPTSLTVTTDENTALSPTLQPSPSPSLDAQFADVEMLLLQLTEDEKAYSQLNQSQDNPSP